LWICIAPGANSQGAGAPVVCFFRQRRKITTTWLCETGGRAIEDDEHPTDTGNIREAQRRKGLAKR